MPFALFLLAMVLDVFITAISTMVLSSVLNSIWWDAIPALGFPEAILVGLLRLAISYATGLSVHSYTKNGIAYRVFVTLVVIPFLLSWVIGALNDELIPVFPDMGYGTALVFCVVTLILAAIAAFISTSLTRLVKKLEK